MKKIKVALVGLGGMGTGHYRAYEGIDEMELVAVCDVRINESELKEKLEGKSLNLYDDLDEMLGKEQPDMVDIVTPSYLHADMVIKCLLRKTDDLDGGRSGKDFVRRKECKGEIHGRARRKVYEAVCLSRGRNQERGDRKTFAHRFQAHFERS